MRRCLGVLACAALLLLPLATPATAQTGGDTRPTGTTFLGDTGIWFVPSAEVVGDREFAVSGHYNVINREQGFSAVQTMSGTFAVGLNDRVELFGAVQFLTRIDRDLRPLFRSDIPSVGGLVNEYPLVNDGFSGNQVGDLLVGAKFNILSEERQNAAAVAVRGLVKIPTGDSDSGVSTGKLDGEVDLVVTKASGAVEVSGFGGFIVRGDPGGIDISDGFRYGVGLSGPVNGRLRVFGELIGESRISDSIQITSLEEFNNGQLRGDTASVLLDSPLRSPLDVSFGLQWNTPSGIFVGGGLNIALKHESRSIASQGTPSADRVGALFRIGYHPGVKVYTPPPPPPDEPPAPNQPPTVTAQCDPCEVLFGEESRLRADASDPDGDPLEYRWSAPAGDFQDPPNRATMRWQAPNQAGPVPISVTVTDGRGGSATDTVTVRVNAPPPPPRREYVFEDVHFDFDRYSLRPGATRVLDEVVAALEDDPSLRIEIEGHTCNIGTAEYNLALGDRRSSAVQDYLASRGVGGRLTTVSYGEERPQHDNSREETRRLNRRAALVVRVQ